MKFSIITCTKNSARFVEDNIRSVKSQVFENYEHIFVDGYSKDGTAEIINRYYNEHPDKVKIFKLNPTGISSAMNEGVKRSNGDYLIHLNSDDSFYDCGVLEDVNDYLNKWRIDWIYGKINVLTKTGSMGIFPNRKIFQYNSNSSLGKYLLKFYNYIPHQAVFVRREIFEKYGYFDESISSAMDPDMWMRIKDKTSWRFFDRIISNYSIRHDSETIIIENKIKNQRNFRMVQAKYLNNFELALTFFVNKLMKIRNKKYYQ